MAAGKKWLKWLPWALLGLIAVGIFAQEGYENYRDSKSAQKTIFAMDTVMNLTVYGEGAVMSYGDGTPTTGEEMLEMLADEVERMEQMCSATREDSVISVLNRDGNVVVPSEVKEILKDSYSLSVATGGALDITAYPAVKAWGFTTGEYRVPDEAELSALAEKIDWRKVDMQGATVTLPEGMEIDLGAVAKGALGDELWLRLRWRLFKSALLDLGQSSIVAMGTKPDGSAWRIGIQDPAGEGYLGVLELTDKAMGTSGSYQRYFEQDGVRYCHIIDPETAAPAQSGLASVTVVADSCLLCDGLSTALFVMGLEESVEFWRSSDHEFEAIFVEEDGRISVTAGLEDAFALAESHADREVTVIR